MAFRDLAGSTRDPAEPITDSGRSPEITRETKRPAGSTARSKLEPQAISLEQVAKHDGHPMISLSQYLNHGIDPVVDAEDFKITMVTNPEGYMSFDIRQNNTHSAQCKEIAARLAPHIAPEVTKDDMPVFLDEKSRNNLFTKFQRMPADRLRTISRDALALDLHTPAAYWKKAVADCVPIFHNWLSVLARLPDEDRELAETMESKLNEPLNFLSESLNQDEYLVGRPSQLIAFMVTFDAFTPFTDDERALLTTHVLHQSRAMNRAARQFDKIFTDFPDVARPAIERLRYSGSFAAVMDSINTYSTPSLEEHCDRMKKSQQLTFRKITKEFEAISDAPPTGMSSIISKLMPDELKLKACGKMVKLAADADPKTKDGIRTLSNANFALLSQYPLGEEYHPGLLLYEVVSRQILQREMAVSKALGSDNQVS